ncbi:MAG TPA: hypothetical protein VGJ93_13690 [Desulfuromonadaceae bacterium]|jgi:hypothetical protein
MNQEQPVHQVNTDSRLDETQIAILDTLRAGHPEDQIIDVPRLQMECQANGLSPRRFSHGFVRLLLHGLLEPRGEFAYVFSKERIEAKAMASELEMVAELHDRFWQTSFIQSEDARR